MMKEEWIPMLHPDVVWRTMDDGAVLVKPEAGRVRVLNEVGTTIWQLMDGEHNLGQIEARLVEKYDVGPGQARSDLHQFLTELMERDLIVWNSGGPAR